MKDIAIHIEDLDNYLPLTNQFDKIHIVWFEEIDMIKLKQKLIEKIDYNRVIIWLGDTVWPKHNDKRFLYYLWISASNQSIDYSVVASRHFICLNNTPRYHRIEFLNTMYDQNLFKKTLISWNNQKIKIKGIEQATEWVGSISYPTSILPVIDLPIDELNNSALSIILETNIDQFDISEKTFQCIAVAQPFLSYGMCHLYQTLTSMGFRLLPIIDYSFDTEQDCQKRKNMIIKELKKLSKYDPTELKQIFKKVSLYNQKKFKEIVKTLDLPFESECVLSEKLTETKKILLLKKTLYK